VRRTPLPENTIPVTEARPTRFFYGYVVVAAALLIDLVMAGIHFTFGAFFKPVSAEFGWTRAATSGAFTLYSMFHGFLFIITGRISDRFGPKPMLIASAAFFGLGFFLMSRITSIWQLYVFYGGLIAVGMSGGFVPLMSTIARWFDKRRGLMTGLVLAGGGLGQAVFPPLTTWLIEKYDWRQAYLMFGIGVLVVLFLLSLFLKRDPAQMGQVPYGARVFTVPGKSERRNVYGLSLKEAMGTRSFWQYALAIIFVQFGLGMMVVHAAPHGMDLGMEAAAAATVVTTFAGVGVGARVVFGWVTDRVGGKRVMAMACGVLGVSLLGMSAVHSVPGFYAFAAVFGLGFGSFVSSMSPLAAQLFGLGHHGAIFGGASFGAAIGGGLGPLMAGAIFDSTGAYTIAFIITGALSLVSLAAVLSLKVPEVAPSAPSDPMPG
jgi:MFS family permease